MLKGCKRLARSFLSHCGNLWIGHELIPCETPRSIRAGFRFRKISASPKDKGVSGRARQRFCIGDDAL